MCDCCLCVCRSCCSNVTVSLGTITSESCKNGWTDRDAAWVEDSDMPREPCIWWGPDPPCEGAILRWERGVPMQSIGTYCRELCRMAESIDLPFGSWTRVGRRKHMFNNIHQVAPMCPHGRARWRYLVNTIEPPVCGGDAARPYVKLLWPLVFVPTTLLLLTVYLITYTWEVQATSWCLALHQHDLSHLLSCTAAPCWHKSKELSRYLLM